ncbi:hypothetical protein K8R03_00450 [Candidatus Kaiserbacteria bacterium]|nr:hypothetical protein [Candidatus Kaiserbacteria bacterium]
MKPLAIIAEGGGLQAGFATGVLVALNDKIPGLTLRRASTFVASSASVGNILGYISEREQHVGQDMWTSVLTSDKFLLPNPLRRLLMGRTILDVDYLVDVIFKRDYPFHIGRIAEAAEKLFFPVFNCETNEIEFFTNAEHADGYFMRGDKRIVVRKLPTDSDFYEFIRAAKAIPFLYSKKVRVGDATYIDGGIREPFTIDLPETAGIPKILILSSRHGTASEFFWLFFLGVILYIFCSVTRRGALNRTVAKDLFKKAFTNRRLMKKVRELVRAGEMLVIAPDKKLGGVFDNSAKTMRRNFDIGENQVLRRAEEILSFVGVTMPAL